AQNIMLYRRWIVAYFVVTAALGAYLGYVVGYLIVVGPLRSLASHDWVFELWIEGRRARGLWPFAPIWAVVVKLLARPRLVRWAVQGRTVRRLQERWGLRSLLKGSSWEAFATFAYVLTKVEHAGRQVLYRGQLAKFGVGPDGKPTYLLLAQAHR